MAACLRSLGEEAWVREGSFRIALTAAGAAAVVAAAVPFVAARSDNSVALAGAWQTVWTENFSGPAGAGVDTRYWQYDVGQGTSGTGEIEEYTSSVANIHLDGNGALDITALKQPEGGWTSGRIVTKSASFAAPVNGQLTVSADIEQPDATAGPGYWPAFWLLGPGQWPEDGEIDVLEDVDALSEHSGALHCGNLTSLNRDGTTGPCHEHKGISSGLLPCQGCQVGYHVYSVTIDRRDPSDQQIRWYLDGRQFFAVSESRVGAAAWTTAVDHGFSIIMDLAIGGAYPDSVCGCSAPTAKTPSGGTMSIRYIKVSKWTPLSGLGLMRRARRI
jgi:beta-glucanase (GH16 family)